MIFKNGVYLLVTLTFTSQKNLFGNGFQAALDSLASSNLIINDVTLGVLGFPQVMAYIPEISLIKVYASKFSMTVWWEGAGGIGIT